MRRITATATVAATRLRITDAEMERLADPYLPQRRAGF
jgi:hypothetical protein